jgi:hypothetical protein
VAASVVAAEASAARYPWTEHARGLHGLRETLEAAAAIWKAGTVKSFAAWTLRTLVAHTATLRAAATARRQAGRAVAVARPASTAADRVQLQPLTGNAWTAAEVARRRVPAAEEARHLAERQMLHAWHAVEAALGCLGTVARAADAAGLQARGDRNAAGRRHDDRKARHGLTEVEAVHARAVHHVSQVRRRPGLGLDCRIIVCRPPTSR